MRRLSHSQVRTFLRCPQQGKLTYVDRLAGLADRYGELNEEGGAREADG